AAFVFATILLSSSFLKPVEGRGVSSLGTSEAWQGLDDARKLRVTRTPNDPAQPYGIPVVNDRHKEVESCLTAENTVSEVYPSRRSDAL
ncbi:hypothetical protein GE09DRAFT_1154977, partial [Coniochaeta sp. 2T2.1]